MAVSGSSRSSSSRWPQTVVSVAFCVRVSARGTDCDYTFLRSRVSWTTSKCAQLITRRCLECVYTLHCHDIYLPWITYVETDCILIPGANGVQVDVHFFQRVKLQRNISMLGKKTKQKTNLQLLCKLYARFTPETGFPLPTLHFSEQFHDIQKHH